MSLTFLSKRAAVASSAAMSLSPEQIEVEQSELAADMEQIVLILSLIHI